MADTKRNGKAYGSPVIDPDLWGIGKAFAARIVAGEGDTFDAYLVEESKRRKAQRVKIAERNARISQQHNPPERIIEHMDREARRWLTKIYSLRDNGASRHKVAKTIQDAKAAVDNIFIQWTLTIEPIGAVNHDGETV